MMLLRLADFDSETVVSTGNHILFKLVPLEAVSLDESHGIKLILPP